MIKKELRKVEVEVWYCDYCGKEIKDDDEEIVWDVDPEQNSHHYHKKCYKKMKEEKK